MMGKADKKMRFIFPLIGINSYLRIVMNTR